ncbi:hypothetical protein [Brenneria uluponensis]|uniref:hypothetical protein n=1 Tax=Brenneria uluponensis TaxID=3057057 RepID=UPI0028F0A0F9|nr:hypothetical protein [Brenneria ulupoensis]
MKELPTIPKISLDEVENSKKIKPIIAGIVVGILAGSSVNAIASTDTMPVNNGAQENIINTRTNPQAGVAVILNQPALYGQVFAAHYSHSSHASHASHYSCTPGKTC